MEQDGAKGGSNGSVYSFGKDEVGENVVGNLNFVVGASVVAGQRVHNRAEHFDVSENLVTDIFEKNFESKVS